MNLATKLTLLRIIAIPFFLLAFLWKAPDQSLASDWGKIIATVIFIIAAITDYYDGYLARKYKQVTTFGKFMDPIADKLLVSTALIVLAEYRSLSYTSSWVAVIIIAREFAVTGLRLICAEKGKVIDASNAGKIKTASQLTAIITCLVFISTRVYLISNNMIEYHKTFMQFYGITIQILMAIAVISTIYSGYDYFRKNWHFLDE
jgi:CDP-diacylglycerol--glycerol-3-phosphate 3-phosphatidyltransferase